MTSLSRTFFGATLFTGDGVSNWDTSRVSDLSFTFQWVTSFTGDGVSTWDTSSVTSLRSTFSGATSFTGDGLSNWKTSSVMDMARTFYGATSFTGDALSDWDTSSVTSLQETFFHANSFSGKVWRWNVDSVINVEDTFQNTPAVRLCFKRFIFELWSAQGVHMPNEWSSISSCTWSLEDALGDVECFGSPCTCTSINPEAMRCLNCGMICSLVEESDWSLRTSQRRQQQRQQQQQQQRSGTIPSSLGHCSNLTRFSVEETYGTLNGA